MQTFFFLLCMALCSVGIFATLSILFSAPSKQQVWATYTTKNKNKQSISFQQKIETQIAIWISRLPLDRLQNKLQPVLEYDKKNRSPEQYLANCLLKVVVLFLSGCILAVVHPAFLLVSVIAPVAVYFDEYQNLKERQQTIKENLEKDLPDFLSAVLAELSHSRDIVRMMTNYLPYAGVELKKELQTTLADMQSGNYERALMRLDQRVVSSHLSAVVRGFIGVIHGNDETTYFQLLAHTIQQAQITRQKQKALKVKPKFLLAAILVLISFLVLFMGILFVDLSIKSKELFG